MVTEAAAIQPRPVYPTDLMSSIQTSLNAVLVRGDRAWRQNRELQRMMRQDSDIVHAIDVRELAGVMGTWRIKPEDEDDLEHKARCLAMQRAIERIPKFVQMRRNIAKAVWYGLSGGYLHYATLPQPIVATASSEQVDAEGNPAESASAAVTTAPDRFVPVSSDSIRWTPDGRMVLLVNRRSDRFRDNEQVMTDGGSGVVIPDDQRSGWVVAVWNTDSPDLLDYSTAERVYAGHGLRSMLWDAWLEKQLLRQLATSYAERLARGTMLGVHDGSAAGEEAIKRVIDLIGQTSAVTIPASLAETVGGVDKVLQVFEPQGTGNQILRDMVADAGEKLKLAILGQTLTTGTAATGLGSGVAEAHQDTFANQVKYDVEVTDEALSRDLVAPMWAANFPNDPRVPQFVSAIREDEEDVNELMEAAERLVGMGVTLAMNDVRDKGGFREPQGDEPVIGGPGAVRPGVDDLMDGLESRGAV